MQEVAYLWSSPEVGPDVLQSRRCLQAAPLLHFRCHQPYNCYSCDVLIGFNMCSRRRRGRSGSDGGSDSGSGSGRGNSMYNSNEGTSSCRCRPSDTWRRELWQCWLQVPSVTQIKESSFLCLSRHVVQVCRTYILIHISVYMYICLYEKGIRV